MWFYLLRFAPVCLIMVVSSAFRVLENSACVPLPCLRDSGERESFIALNLPCVVLEAWFSFPRVADWLRLPCSSWDCFS